MKKISRLFLLGAFSVSFLAPLCTYAAASNQATGTTAVAPVVDTSVSNNSESTGQPDGTYESAIITTAKEVTTTSTNGAQKLQSYEIQFLSGAENGKAYTLTNDISTNPYNLNPQVGDKVLIFVQPDPQGGPSHAYLEGYDRRAAMYWLIALFVGTLVLLAGWQGFKVALSIIISVLLIGLVLIPSFLKGVNPVPVSFVLVGVLATISSVLTMGWNKKSLVTIIGTIGGTIFAFFVAYVFAGWAHLSGLATDEDRLFFDKNPNLNPQGLLFAGIAIAAMGVVEDVAVSIASGVLEVRQANPNLGFKQLFTSGMVIGRDHMGALANTLVFAYVGGSLSTLLLYTQYGGSWAKFVNFDSVVDEIIRALAGTIGLIFTIPITALLAAWFAVREPVTGQYVASHGHHHH